MIRHYVRLSRMNYAIDAGLLSARLLHHEAQSAPEREDGAAAGLRRPASAAAAIDGAGRAGADLRTDELADELTGMPAVAMSPKAGAHGELCGLLAIRAAIAARGEKPHAHLWCRNPRMAPIPPRRRLPASRCDEVPAQAPTAMSMPRP